MAVLAGVAAGAEADPSAESGRTDRRWAEAASYLQLSPTQWRSMRQARSDHDKRMAALAQEALRLEKQGDERGLARLCQQSRQLGSEHQAQMRRMLGDTQLQRLAQLEQAFQLMPVVLSAQAAGLLDDRLTVAPEGFRQFQVSHEVSFRSVAAKALPGCPADSTEVREGTVTGGVRATDRLAPAAVGGPERQASRAAAQSPR